MVFKVNTFPRRRIAKDGEVPPLKAVAVESICEDIARHSLRFHTLEDKTPYFILQRMEADNIQDRVRDIHPRVTDANESWILHNICKGWSEMNIQNFYDFLFNQFTTKAELSGKDFNEYSVQALSRNCKELSSLRIYGAVAHPRLCAMLFNSITQLTVLSLTSCEQLTLDTVQVISNCLTYLKSLDLSFTIISNDIIYTLCGHEVPFGDSSRSSCCYIKQCEVFSPLKLEYINIARRTGSLVADSAITCLLTHIPTLRRIILKEDFVYSIVTRYTFEGPPLRFIPGFMKPVESFICMINSLREKGGLPSLTFQLEEVNTDSCELGSVRKFLQNFCRLKRLIACTQQLHLGDTLANLQLTHLEAIELLIQSTRDIFTNPFEKFWKSKGPQLKELTLRDKRSPKELRFNELRSVVKLCPNLHCLRLCGLYLSETEVIEDFPSLPKLKELELDLCGDIITLKDLYHKILMSSENISVVNLRILPVMHGFFENLLTEEIFPSLTNVNIQNVSAFR